MDQEKAVTVYGPDGTLLKPCSKRRAKQLISRDCADWIGYNVIKLFITKKDRKRFRQQVLLRDDYVCYICGEKLSPENATVDHIVSRARGGTDYPSNLACCCKDCNNEKGQMDLEEFLALRKAQQEEIS